jgi:antitoxin ParD1/3/4
MLGATIMPTRNVVLSEHHQQFIQTQVESGRYQDAGEVLREGLRLMEERERIEAAKLKMLQLAASKGWEDIAAGRYNDITDDLLEDFIGHLGTQAAQQVLASA